MKSCDHSLVTLAFLREKLLQLQIFKFMTRKLIGMALKLYSSVAKGSKVKVRKIWGLIPTFGKVTGKTERW